VIAFTASRQAPSAVSADLLVVPMFAGGRPGPGAAELKLEDAYRAAKLTGHKDEDLLLPKQKGDRFAAGAVLLVGVGERSSFDLTAARRAMGRISGTARRFARVATTSALALDHAPVEDRVQAVAEGLGLGSYRFDTYKAKKDGSSLKRLTVLTEEPRAGRDGLAKAAAIVDAVNWARDMVNTPAGDMPPAMIAEEAKAMAGRAGLRCKIWNESQLRDGGFGGILGVGAGSANPPRMIEISYKGAGNAKPIALTGKGISFDSGGLDIKDAKGMETMKDDMAGAASILATMKVIAALAPKVNVISAIPCSENLPGATATKPGDVLHHRGGKTSEVVNTDAEGRLVLADALAYLAEREPSEIVDTATLTSSAMIALGEEITALFSNDDRLAGDLLRASDGSGEPMWRLPLWRPYRSQIDSPVADIKNQGERYGGAITAALFLSEFVGRTPWAHLDIAGNAFSSSGTDLSPKGATGVPIRTLVRFVLGRAS
jgi:leucyl aminopeptidase